MLDNNEQVTWYPEHIKHGRFGNFLEHAVDWNISRNRYWGTPLNVWICEDCGHEEAPKSRAALQAMAKKPVGEDLELHKPYIDEIICLCEKCGGDMKRTPEVIDVWFDSGSMPYAQHHYPFENNEKFQEQFPADVVIEGIDQTRGFFYSLMAVSTLFTGKAPYKRVLSLGHVLDENGQKMSKSKGNALDPVELMNQYGADALRWSLLVDSSPWNPKRFSTRNVLEAKSKLVDTLDHTFKFYQLYTNIDCFTYDPQNTGERSKMDRWILSRLHHTIHAVTDHMEQYQFTQAARELGALVEELSNWYIRRSRSRFWAKGMSLDKRGAFSTLHEVLTNISLLLAPFTPFIAEDIYRQLHNRSVHLEDYPKAQKDVMNTELEKEMQQVLTVVELGRSLRNERSLKIKQPLAKMLVTIEGSGAVYEQYNEIIREELNVKEVEWLEDLSAYEKVQYKLNFKTAGAAFGRHVNNVKEYVLQMNEAEKKALQLEGSVKVTIGEEEFPLLAEHVIKESVVDDGYALGEEGSCRVLLDTTLTEELLQEGQMRELIRAIQEARKKWGLPVEQYISISFSTDETSTELLKNHEAFLRKNVLLNQVAYTGQPTDNYIETEVFNRPVQIYVDL